MIFEQKKAASASHWFQAGRLAFIALYVITLVIGFGWLISNVRQIEPESRAVVLRFGAIERVQDSGLLFAWPQPFEQVVILPAADRVVDRTIQALIRPPSVEQRGFTYLANDATAGMGYLLTGDAGVVQIGVHLFYKVTDPFAYVMQRQHVEYALNRIVERSAVIVSASRDLDTILVARPELVGSSAEAAKKREQLRSDLVNNINHSLEALKKSGASLGIYVDRVDLKTNLPWEAIDAFNAVLTASQLAKQAVAEANDNAAQIRQKANQDADRILQQAKAKASERLAKAQTDTATIDRLAKNHAALSDPGLLWRLYRQRINIILSQAGSVTMVNPKDDSRLILQGKKP